VRRGVLYGVIAFGLVAGLGAFVYELATGGSLKFAGTTLAILVAALVIHPLKLVAFRVELRRDRHGCKLVVFRTQLHGDRPETLGVALAVFAFLVGALGVIVGVVGRRPWLGAAAGLVGIAVVFAALAAWVLRARDQRRPATDGMRWSE
jgi:peptidoglycan/LPS O-acetylase OafA/YrhL